MVQIKIPREDADIYSLGSLCKGRSPYFFAFTSPSAENFRAFSSTLLKYLAPLELDIDFQTLVKYMLSFKLEDNLNLVFKKQLYWCKFKAVSRESSAKIILEFKGDNRFFNMLLKKTFPFPIYAKTGTDIPNSMKCLEPNLQPYKIGQLQEAYLDGGRFLLVKPTFPIEVIKKDISKDRKYFQRFFLSSFEELEKGSVVQLESEQSTKKKSKTDLAQMAASMVDIAKQTADTSDADPNAAAPPPPSGPPQQEKSEDNVERPKVESTIMAQENIHKASTEDPMEMVKKAMDKASNQFKNEKNK